MSTTPRTSTTITTTTTTTTFVVIGEWGRGAGFKNNITVTYRRRSRRPMARDETISFTFKVKPIRVYTAAGLRPIHTTCRRRYCSLLSYSNRWKICEVTLSLRRESRSVSGESPIGLRRHRVTAILPYVANMVTTGNR